MGRGRGRRHRPERRDGYAATVVTDAGLAALGCGTRIEIAMLRLASKFLEGALDYSVPGLVALPSAMTLPASAAIRLYQIDERIYAHPR